MALFPRFVQSEFAPMFRLLDDYSQHIASTRGGANGFGSSLKTFQPRFDIKETKEAYELHGELPGVAQKDIDINWVDATTLSIKGHTESYREEGTRPAGFVEGAEEQGKITNGASHKATVEDENANTDVATQQQQQGEEKPKEESKYWLSERSYGEFARTFSFPSKIDADHVKASLNNGILSIIVPKAAAPVSKRINIE